MMMMMMSILPPPPPSQARTSTVTPPQQQQHEEKAGDGLDGSTEKRTAKSWLKTKGFLTDRLPTHTPCIHAATYTRRSTETELGPITYQP